MKRKYLYMLVAALFSFVTSSCEKDEPYIDYEDPYDYPYDNPYDTYPGSGNSGSQNSSSLPYSLSGKFIHLYRSDGQTLVVEHLNSHAAHIANQTFISYIDGYAPEYKYSTSDGHRATYYLMWTPSATPLIGGIRRFQEITLTSGANSRGSFTGTMWVEGWHSDATPYRKNETSVKGTFYIGGSTDPNPGAGSGY